MWNLKFAICVVKGKCGFMRFMKTNELTDGMIVGKPIYNEQFQVLQREKTFLDHDMIMQLKLMNYSGIYILDDFSKDVDFREMLSEEARYEIKKHLDHMRMYPNDMVTMRDLDRCIDSLTDTILLTPLADIINFSDLYYKHEYNDTHCINVAILAGLIGRKLEFERFLLKDLIKSALLHDMGKFAIPNEILEKPGRLTVSEYELVKQAPMAGYNMFAGNAFVNSIVKTGLLQHHERFDGSGYPQGLQGEEISVFGRIIAIADVFDALISDRPFRKANAPVDAIRYLLEDRGQFDMNLVEYFLWCVVPYPNGTTIKLTDGRDALVLHNYVEEPMRPKVKVIPTGEIVDLKEDEQYQTTSIVLV